MLRWPAWLHELVSTGEALALLALGGGMCVSLRPDALGTTVETTPRRKVGRRLEALTHSWKYEVLRFFGDGTKGRAIAFQPTHRADRIFVAFRGVRNKEAHNEAADRAGPLHDRVNLGRWEPTPPGSWQV